MRPLGPRIVGSRSKSLHSPSSCNASVLSLGSADTAPKLPGCGAPAAAEDIKQPRESCVDRTLCPMAKRVEALLKEVATAEQFDELMDLSEKQLISAWMDCAALGGAPGSPAHRVGCPLALLRSPRRLQGVVGALHRDDANLRANFPRVRRVRPEGRVCSRACAGRPRICPSPCARQHCTMCGR